MGELRDLENSALPFHRHEGSTPLSCRSVAAREAAALRASSNHWAHEIDFCDGFCVGSSPCSCSACSHPSPIGGSWSNGRRDGHRVKARVPDNTQSYHPRSPQTPAYVAPPNQRLLLLDHHSHSRGRYSRACPTIVLNCPPRHRHPCNSHPHFGCPDIQPPSSFRNEPKLPAAARVHRGASPSSGPLPPFPSTSAPPFVLCQHCFLLLLLPPGSQSSVTRGRSPLVILKCGFCSNLSFSSTRHLCTASASAASAPSSRALAAASFRLLSQSEELAESISMPGYDSSLALTQEARSAEAATIAISDSAPQPNRAVKENSEQSNRAFKGNGEHVTGRPNSDAVQNSIGVSTEACELTAGSSMNGDSLEIRTHAKESVYLDDRDNGRIWCSEGFRTGAYANGMWEHVGTDGYAQIAGNSVNGGMLEIQQQRAEGVVVSAGRDDGHALQGKDADARYSVNDTSEHPMQDVAIVAREYRDAELMQSNGKDMEGSLDATTVLTALEGCCTEAREFCNAGFAIGHEIQGGSDFDRQPEIMVMNSVQQWVDSLSSDAGYESDSPRHCSEKCPIGCEKHAPLHHHSPLHQHFGYKSPSELLEKVVFSEDDETKGRTETNSTASSSSCPNNACQQQEVGAPGMSLRSLSLRLWTGPGPNVSSIERDAQSSLTKLLRRRLKRGSHSSWNSKSRVTVNGHVLSSAAIKQAEERAGKLRPGSYWYDSKAGFWGVEGGPCLGILPPFIEELSYPMAGNCSGGDTQLYINGRELHVKDLAVLAGRGLPTKPGRAYSLGFDGLLVDETTGLEIKHLGKLAPTVERKGKGFGMFAANGPPAKTPAVQGNCANSGY